MFPNDVKSLTFKILLVGVDKVKRNTVVLVVKE